MKKKIVLFLDGTSQLVKILEIKIEANNNEDDKESIYKVSNFLFATKLIFIVF